MGRESRKRKRERGQCSQDNLSRPQHELRYKDVEIFQARLNQNSRATLLKLIEVNLHADDWKRVLDSPFGPIVKAVRAHKFSSQLVHYMLFHQVKTTKKWETWYDLQGQLLRFSMEEFAMITRLKCHKIMNRDVSKDNGAVIKLFGVKNLKMDDLRLAFVSMNQDNPLKYRMALLLIVEGVILGIENAVKINVTHINLLEDIDRFTKFPWGRVAYVETHEGLRGALENRIHSLNGSKDGGRRKGYKLKGYPMSFQLWLYEAVPCIASVFAEVQDIKAFPRCLRWSSTETPTLKDVASLLDKDSATSSTLKTNIVLIEDESEIDLLEGCKIPDEVEEAYFDQAVKNYKQAQKRTNIGGKDQAHAGGSVDGLMRVLNNIVERLTQLENKVDAGFKAIHKALGISTPVEENRNENDTENESEQDERNAGADEEEVEICRGATDDNDKKLEQD